MKQFKILNNTLGWLTFIVAATTYCLTVEPTASFWDCPEFITTAYKLEVGHPPGAPFFMLTANLFTQFQKFMGTEGIILYHTTPMGVDHFFALFFQFLAAQTK